MSLSRIVPIALALAYPAASFAQWLEYVSRQDLFTINLPGEPTITDTEWASEYGAVFPARVYTVDYRENYHYSLTVVDYSDSEQIHLARTNRTEADSPAGYEYWRIDKLASVAYAATKLRRRGGEVTYDAWHHIDRVPGHMLQITNADDSRTYASMYLHADRLYILEASVPANAPPQGHFQQSLGFIDEQGNELRYDYADDGSLVLEQDDD